VRDGMRKKRVDLHNECGEVTMEADYAHSSYTTDLLTATCISTILASGPSASAASKHHAADYVFQIVANTSGSHVAASLSNHTVKVYATVPSSPWLVLACSLSGHEGAISGVEFFTDDDALLCTSSADGSVRVWDLRMTSAAGAGHGEVQRWVGAASLFDAHANAPRAAVTQASGLPLKGAAAGALPNALTVGLLRPGMSCCACLFTRTCWPLGARGRYSSGTGGVPRAPLLGREGPAPVGAAGHDWTTRTKWK
jgi:hypothetical protein